MLKHILQLWINWVYYEKGALRNRIIKLMLRLRPAFFAFFIKKVLFIKRETCKTVHGTFFIDPCSLFGHVISMNGVYEPSMVSVLNNYLKSGSTFIDLGAGEGYFSVIGSTIVGDRGRVFAVEPQCRLEGVIRKNLELNKCKNVTILSLVISDKDEDVFLYLTYDINTGSSSLLRSVRYFLPKQKAKSTTLLNVFKQNRIDRCDLLKIDIEGWEYEAILGSPDLFRDHRIDAIAIEFHPQLFHKRGLSEKKIIDFLSSHGYKQHNSLFYFRDT